MSLAASRVGAARGARRSNRDPSDAELGGIVNQPEDIWSFNVLDCFDIVPTRDELPIGEIEKLGPRDLCKLRGSLVEIHRHEDELLNSRLEAYLLAAAIVAAGYTQVYPAQSALALLFSVAGFFLSCVMFSVLRRTAKAIQWNIAVVVAIERLLYPSDLRVKRPYSRRREGREPRRPASGILGAVLPFSGATIFVLLGLLAILGPKRTWFGG